MIRVIRNLLTRSMEAPAGCGFLTPREIDGWFEDSLQPSRREAFREHREGCSACALLAADLEVFHGVVTRGVLESERREFNETAAVLKAQLLQKLDRAESSRPRASRSIWGYGLGMAAAAALVALVAVPFVLRDDVPGGPMIALPDGTTLEVQALPFPDRMSTLRGEAISMDDLWERADAAYEAKNFAKSEALLSTFVERMPDDHDGVLQLGASLVMLRHYDEAIPVLQRACELAEEIGLRGDRDYYMLGVAALNDGDRSAAIEAFRRSADAGGEYGTLSADALRGFGE